MNTKEYILSKCNSFSISQNLTILKFLQDSNAKIHECSDGTRINLDTLSAKDLTKLKLKVKELDKPISEKYQIE